MLKYQAEMVQGRRLMAYYIEHLAHHGQHQVVTFKTEVHQ